MVESGFDQFVTASVAFIVAPPGTPLPIRKQISEAVALALASTEVKEAFSKMGAQQRPASPEALASYVAQQQLRWTRIVEATRISVE
jgi:tripartite-type tricarboxylate transporter receptor subunit TctC